MEPIQSSASHKVVFRFVFLLFTGFILLFNNGGYMLYSGFQQFLMYPALEKPVAWVGQHFFKIPGDIQLMNNGSGDTLFHNVLLIILLIISCIGTVIWSLAAKKETQYDRLNDVLRIAVRYYIAGMMIIYGVDKLFKTQFQYPDLFMLTTSLGDMTPKTLAWSFLGHSYLYNVFMGIAELSCVLLLFRKTVSLGAVIAFMVSLNVMVVNYSFDVPVKMISTALVILSGFLLLNDLPKFYRLFFKGESISLQPTYVPLFTGKWKTIRILLKGLFIISNLGIVLAEDISYKMELNQKHPMYGYYEADSLNSSLSSPFDKIIINNAQSVRIVKDDEMQHLRMTTDSSEHSLQLISRVGSDTMFTFNFQYAPTGVLVLKKNDSQWKYKRVYDNTSSFKLNQQPFEWISQYPRNY